MPILIICVVAYLLVIITEWMFSRDYKRFLFELLPLVGLVIIGLLLSQAKDGYVGGRFHLDAGGIRYFGMADSATGVVLIMFVAIMLGVAARYVFYLRGQFAWLDFAKPLCISPLLMIPLIGSVQGVQEFQPIQIVSFALLAFQNGFFWQAVLQRSRSKK